MLTLLNGSLGKHIRTNAYKYRKRLDYELARVRRVKEIQNRVVAFLGAAIVATMIGLANVLGRMYYDVIQSDEQRAATIAIVFSASLLVCVVGSCISYMLCRRCNNCCGGRCGKLLCCFACCCRRKRRHASSRRFRVNPWPKKTV